MDRLEALRDAVKTLLAGGHGPVGATLPVAGVLALRRAWPATVPHLFCPGDSLDDLALWPKYALPMTLNLLQDADPDIRLGMVIRGCEERGLIELAKRNQVDLGRLTLIGLACTAEERDACRCEWPYPTHIDVGEKVEGAADPLLAEHQALTDRERTAFWQQQFAKCVKCYACRTVCPQCFCETCVLEDNLWVQSGTVTPAFPAYHLVRAYHTIGKCVGCRECEQACPADIPLTVLYTLLRKDAEEQFGYIPGRSVDDPPPLVVELAQGG
jgi:ferredoxin